jgi:hypothetical protein
VCAEERERETEREASDMQAAGKSRESVCVEERDSEKERDESDMQAAGDSRERVCRCVEGRARDKDRDAQNIEAAGERSVCVCVCVQGGGREEENVASDIEAGGASRADTYTRIRPDAYTPATHQRGSETEGMRAAGAGRKGSASASEYPEEARHSTKESQSYDKSAQRDGVCESQRQRQAYAEYRGLGRETRAKEASAVWLFKDGVGKTAGGGRGMGLGGGLREDQWWIRGEISEFNGMQRQVCVWKLVQKYTY